MLDHAQPCLGNAILPFEKTSPMDSPSNGTEPPEPWPGVDFAEDVDELQEVQSTVFTRHWSRPHLGV